MVVPFLNLKHAFSIHGVTDPNFIGHVLICRSHRDNCHPESGIAVRENSHITAARIRIELLEAPTVAARVERCCHILTELTSNVGITAALPPGFAASFDTATEYFFEQ